VIINFDLPFSRVSRNLINTIFLCDKNDITDKQFAEAKGIVVRLGVTLNKEFLTCFLRLEFIATITTGLDHIDNEYCKINNIRVISLKGETKFLENISATPEHTWCLILSLIRRVPWAALSVENGCWDRNLFVGEELFEKTLGIIGFGRIGKILSRYAIAFGMNVLAYGNADIDSKKHGVKKVGLATLLNESHIISIHLPLEKNTINFINNEHFQSMKLKPWFINTARGAIVNEDALLEALNEGLIKGAALDVLSNETGFNSKKPVNKLIEYMKSNTNLIITPHIAGTTVEAMAKTVLFIENKIITFYPGLAVNKEKG